MSEAFSIFDILTMIGGLCLFLFGMNVMGESLERRAGNSLRTLLSKLTTGRIAGLLTGLGVTAVIQSSSATTIMVVGFVNSGIMTLKQAINVIMGANIGTTVTAWILSLSGISSDNVFVKLLKPSSFTPVLALIGVIFYMFCKSDKKKDTGTILLGFATLMFGMDIMSDAVSGLAELEGFRNLFIAFQNPVLGVLAGAILTAIIQSSSASVGILQTFSATGQITYGASIPIIMGQNIGTCVTALISSVGANKNARRAAMVHLSFNIMGTVILLTVFSVVRTIFNIEALSDAASQFGIAVCHSLFNIICTALLFPMAGLLEKLAIRLVPDKKEDGDECILDQRLFVTPPIALEQCHNVVNQMAEICTTSLKDSLSLIGNFDQKKFEKIKAAEDRTDQLEDMLSTYLVKLSSHNLGENESAEAATLLKAIGDFERIADHSVNIAERGLELKEKEIYFTADASGELSRIIAAIQEIVSLSYTAFTENDINAAKKVEPLEQVVDKLRAELRDRHILRLQKGNCTAVAGFIWSDLLTDFERTSDHCSNIAGTVLDTAAHNMNMHETLRELRASQGDYSHDYQEYLQKYSV